MFELFESNVVFLLFGVVLGLVLFLVHLEAVLGVFVLLLQLFELDFLLGFALILIEECFCFLVVIADFQQFVLAAGDGIRDGLGFGFEFVFFPFLQFLFGFQSFDLFEDLIGVDDGGSHCFVL